MPGNIFQYNSPVDQLHPSDTGVTAERLAAREENDMSKQIGQDYGGAIRNVGEAIEKHDTMAELTTGSASWAVMQNNLHNAWNAQVNTSDIHDNTIQDKFLNDTLEPQISQWQESFTTDKGQQWAQGEANRLRESFYNTTAADMSSRSGYAAKQDLVTSLNSLSTAAKTNPISLDASLGHINSTLDMVKQMNQDRLRPEQMDELDKISFDMKNETVKAYLQGQADKNPALAQKLLDSGKFSDYIKPEEAEQLSRYIQVQAHGKQVDQENAQRVRQQKMQDSNEQTTGQYLGLLTQGKIPSAAEIISNPNLTTQQKNLWVAKGGILSMPQDQLHSAALGDNFSGAVQAVYANQAMTPDGLLAGIRRGDITPAGAAQIQKMQAMAKTPEGMAELKAQNSVLQTVQSQLVKGGPYASDPVGQQQYNSFLNSFYASWNAGINKGLTPAQLSDPKSKDYIGNMAQQFKRTDAQAISDVVNNARTQTAPASAQSASAQPAAKAKTWVIKDGQLVPGG